MKKEEVMKVIHPHLAPTDECQCEAYREYLKTGENKQPNYWIDAECKKYDHYSDRNTMFKEREPQKECDHIIGHARYFKEDVQCEERVWLSDWNDDKYRNSLTEFFPNTYCPECGEKLNLK